MSDHTLTTAAVRQEFALGSGNSESRGYRHAIKMFDRWNGPREDALAAVQRVQEKVDEWMQEGPDQLVYLTAARKDILAALEGFQ